MNEEGRLLPASTPIAYISRFNLKDRPIAITPSPFCPGPDYTSRRNKRRPMAAQIRNTNWSGVKDMVGAGTLDKSVHRLERGEKWRNGSIRIRPSCTQNTNHQLENGR